MIKLHYNWKYEFLRPTIEQVMVGLARYKQKWPGAFSTAAAAAKETAGPSSAAAAAE